MNLGQYNHEYDEAESGHDPSISPCLNISEHLFCGLGFALGGVLLSAPDVFQHIEPVHNLFHVGVFREPGDSVQSFLFNRLHNNALIVFGNEVANEQSISSIKIPVRLDIEKGRDGRVAARNPANRYVSQPSQNRT